MSNWQRLTTLVSDGDWYWPAAWPTRGVPEFLGCVAYGVAKRAGVGYWRPILCEFFPWAQRACVGVRRWWG